jgi:hypothetical protein
MKASGLYQTGDDARAAVYFEIAAKAGEMKPETRRVDLYNLACVYARLGLARQAMERLAAAVELGFDRIDLLETDQDLEPLRTLPEFQDFLKRVKHRH